MCYQLHLWGLLSPLWITHKSCYTETTLRSVVWFWCRKIPGSGQIVIRDWIRRRGSRSDCVLSNHPEGQIKQPLPLRAPALISGDVTSERTKPWGASGRRTQTSRWSLFSLDETRSSDSSEAAGEQEVRNCSLSGSWCKSWSTTWSPDVGKQWTEQGGFPLLRSVFSIRRLPYRKQQLDFTSVMLSRWSQLLTTTCKCNVVQVHKKKKKPVKVHSWWFWISLWKPPLHNRKPQT